MIFLKFIATKQRLIEAEQPFVVANSIDYLSTVFELSAEWNNCINTAVFRKASGTAFSVQLDENNSCMVPWEVIESPYFTVSIYGVCGTKRITTNRVVVKVEESGYAKGKTPEKPTPTVYETIINKLDAMGSAALCDAGASAGNVPVLNNDGKLEKSIIPEMSAEEIDPVFTASPAYGIKSTDIDNWNNKTGFSGDYNDLINKPEMPSDLSDLTGILPISQGGTGATTLAESWKNFQIYTDVTQLGLYFPTTTSKIFQAMPVGSIGMFPFEYNKDTITDAPANYGIYSVFYPATNRPLLLCQQCVGTGSNYTYFYVGYYNSSARKITWYKIFNGSMQLNIAQGGTGATTADEALTNLCAVKSVDIGDVSTLSTNDKTVVGAINELYSMINTGG